VALLMFGVLAACGPSSAELRAAKTAQYAAGPNQMLDVAVQVAQRKYEVKDIDPAKNVFVTEWQWYSAEGGRRGTSNEGNGDYVVNAHGTDVRLQLLIKVVSVDPGHVAVTVVPHVFQLVAGSPQPRELKEEDPNVPPWVHGRVDDLTIDIYNASKQFAEPANR